MMGILSEVGRGVSHLEDHVAPPSCVAKCDPFAAVTVALLLSVALTATKSSRVGGLTSRQCTPLLRVRTMVPDFPTTQHTSSDGADPARRSVVTPLLTA